MSSAVNGVVEERSDAVESNGGREVEIWSGEERVVKSEIGDRSVGE